MTKYFKNFFTHCESFFHLYGEKVNGVAAQLRVANCVVNQPC